MFHLLKKSLLRSRYKKLVNIENSYAKIVNKKDIYDYQLKKFNKTWLFSQTRVPFYQMWQEKFALPEQILSLSELDKFPLLTKSDLIEHSKLIEMTPDTMRYTLTGGTSGLTTKFPMNHGDAQTAWLNTHLGRRWNGINPQDKLLMIWGHSHLFSGRFAKLKQTKRQFKDLLVGIKRVSAYDMSSKNLEHICKIITTSNPRYIIGYGSCLTLLARYIMKSKYQFLDYNIKAIVNTSEPINSLDADLLSNIFKCPVINEYGMAEAGVIGYSVKQVSPINVMWKDYLVGRQNNEVIISTLGYRCFPLINYATEDYSDGENKKSLLSVSSIQGKARAIITVSTKDGIEKHLSVVLLDHILKQLSSISLIHYEQTNSTTVKIMYIASEPIDNSEIIEWLYQNLRNEGIDADPTSIIVQEIDKPLSTISGKRSLLIKDKDIRREQ